MFGLLSLHRELYLIWSAENSYSVEMDAVLEEFNSIGVQGGQKPLHYVLISTV